MKRYFFVYIRLSVVMRFHFFIVLSSFVSQHTKVLVVGLLLSLHIQKTVPVPQFSHALGTHGDLRVLAVLHQGEADAVTATDATRRTRTSRVAWGT